MRKYTKLLESQAQQDAEIMPHLTQHEVALESIRFLASLPLKAACIADRDLIGYGIKEQDVVDFRNWLADQYLMTEATIQAVKIKETHNHKMKLLA